MKEKALVCAIAVSIVAIAVALAVVIHDGRNPAEIARGYDYFDPWTEVLAIAKEKPSLLERTDREGRVALHYCGKAPEVALALIEAGCPVNARDEYGLTPLHVVWNPEVARVLIEHGADVDARAKGSGYTPLHTAVNRSILISHSLRTDGIEPYEFIQNVSFDERIQKAKYLLDAGADINAQAAFGETAADIAMRRVKQYLLSRGGKVVIDKE